MQETVSRERTKIFSIWENLLRKYFRGILFEFFTCVLDGPYVFALFYTVRDKMDSYLHNSIDNFK